MPFKNIIGHERPIRILKTALRRNSLAHAYLFYGEEGIGKRLVAKALAQIANCIRRGQSPVTSDQSLGPPLIKESEPLALPGRAPGQASGSAGDWPGHGGIASEASRPPYSNRLGASEGARCDEEGAASFVRAAETVRRPDSSASPHGPPQMIDDSCGQCSACLHIDAETHPDFISVEPEGTMIKIGQIRALQEQIQLKPMAGRYRFVILNEAEAMNEEAANALLKALEEPPGQTILILVTCKPYAMLTTIVSRCQKIRFTPLTDQQVIMLLKQKKSYDPSQLGRVVALSMGRIGVALELDPKSLEAEWLKFRQIFRCGSSSDMGELLDLAQEYAQDRESTQRALQWIGLLLRDLLMIKVQSKPSSVLMESSSPELLKAATELDVEEVLAFASLVQWIWKALARNINRQLALEVLLMQIRNTMSQKF